MAVPRGLSSDALALRRVAWSVPEWPWIVLVSSAWVTLAGHVAHTLGPGEWVVMVVAMMLPATIPAARAISIEGLWARRYRAPAIFLTTYVAIWSLFGVAACGVWSLIETRGGSKHSTLAISAILVVATGWQFTKRHRRFLKRCHRRRPVGLRGRQADRACVRYGAYHARQCCGACWPLMLAMVPAHLPLLMIGAGALSTWQRLARRPRRAVAATALVSLVLLTLALHLAGAFWSFPPPAPGTG